MRIRDPGWEKVGSGMGKIRIRDGKNSEPGWKKLGAGIRDKHPGSSTLDKHTKLYKKLLHPVFQMAPHH
jgi:hypothetical protein